MNTVIRAYRDGQSSATAKSRPVSRRPRQVLGSRHQPDSAAPAVARRPRPRMDLIALRPPAAPSDRTESAGALEQRRIVLREAQPDHAAVGAVGAKGRQRDCRDARFADQAQHEITTNFAREVAKAREHEEDAFARQQLESRRGERRRDQIAHSLAKRRQTEAGIPISERVDAMRRRPAGLGRAPHSNDRKWPEPVRMGDCLRSALIRPSRFCRSVDQRSKSGHPDLLICEGPPMLARRFQCESFKLLVNSRKCVLFPSNHQMRLNKLAGS